MSLDDGVVFDDGYPLGAAQLRDVVTVLRRTLRSLAWTDEGAKEPLMKRSIPELQLLADATDLFNHVCCHPCHGATHPHLT